jgi:DNA-binding GntR family transcriptional regulator
MPDWSGISPGSDLWIREQVARRIEEAIASGELPPGSRLPSQKQMADEAGVSQHTVSAAVALLKERGILRTRPRLGTFVDGPGAAPPGGG